MTNQEPPSEDNLVSIWGSDCHLTSALTHYSEAIKGSRFESLQLPLEMGEYRVTRIVGRGGMGCVFEGEHRRMQRRVAIKVLVAGTNETPAIQQQFSREVRAVARLLHPNIVTAFDAGQFDDITYLVMEFIDGDSLSHLVSKSGPLSISRAIGYVRQAAVGLGHAHLNSVVHRDVKPGNIMVTSAGTIKILDLGLATLAQDFGSADDQGKKAVCGTPEFMAPEQFLSGADLDARADIYGLGCTLYYLLTGFCPYVGTFLELMDLHQRAPIPRLADRRPDVSPGLQSLLELMLSKTVDDRLQCMEDVVELLGKLEAPSSVPAADSGTLYFADSATPGFGNLKTLAGLNTSTLVIDFGERFIAAATSEAQGEVELQSVGGASDELLLRSAIAFNSRGVPLYGQEAVKRCARRMRGAHTGFFNSVRQRQKIEQSGVRTDATFLQAMLLAKVKAEIAARSRNEFSLILTAPTNFNQWMRSSLRVAADMCAFNDVRLVDRSAMAVFRELGRLPTGKSKARSACEYWLVLDLSDLTMSIALFAVEHRHIQMLAVAGDPRCGHTRWRRRIERSLIDRLTDLGTADGITRDGEQAGSFEVAEGVEMALQRLSLGRSGNLEFLFNGTRVNAEISDNTVVRKCADLLERLGVLIGTVLSDSGLDGECISQCLAIGTLAQLQPIRRMANNLGIQCKFTEVDQIALVHAAAHYENLRTHSNHLCPTVSVCNANELLLVHQEASGREVDRQIVLPRLSALPAYVSQAFRFRASASGSKVCLIEVETIDGRERSILAETPIPRGSFVTADASVSLKADAFLDATIRAGTASSTWRGAPIEISREAKALFQKLRESL